MGILPLFVVPGVACSSVVMKSHPRFCMGRPVMCDRFQIVEIAEYLDTMSDCCTHEDEDKVFHISSPEIALLLP